ncbi:MAG: TetR/AcrR family transcriptional regulator [Pseudolysinimonas sp.]
MIDVRPDGFVVLGRERAKPLSPDERRAAIIDAVIPLIRERGREITSREMAEAAGVAEGTIFRAFGDKESVIQAAIQRLMDPEPLRARLRGIDPDEPTEDKVRQVIQLLRDRLEGFIGFMGAIGMTGPPPGEHGQPRTDEQWLAIMEQLFHPDEIAVPVHALAFYLRMLAFGSAIPVFNEPHAFSTDDLTDFVMHGILPGTARTHIQSTTSATTASATTTRKKP